MSNKLIKNIQSNPNKVLKEIAMPIYSMASDEVTHNIDLNQEDYEARMAALADSFKEIVAAQDYFSQDDLIENYFDYKEIINNWGAQPHDPETMTAAANFQAALSDELSRVLLMQLNEKKEDVFFKLGLLNYKTGQVQKVL
ncbi:Uncharacterised protein [Legionella israelensis]|nr:hypothetical protein [Legionella israelensis]QBS09612.1 hypothetical protein E4T55_06905 [Legionella israelensis]SCY56024.1 hypothetical protein SAMN02746069_02860 [Legionella israelensis DSM 19235]STX60539.1 Uncharacterised protein [Legionella israelensis]